MPEQKPTLDHHRNILAGSVTSVLGLSLAFPAGSEASPNEERHSALETRPLSAQDLRRDIDGRRSIQVKAETTEIGALLHESLKPLTEITQQGIGLEVALPPLAVRVRSGWLAANEALRILARRVLEHVYEGGTLRVESRLSGARMIIDMVHAGGTVTAASPEPYADPAEDPRFRRVRTLLAGIGWTFLLRRQASGGLAVMVALAVTD
jgi:hypothetical protein